MIDVKELNILNEKNCRCCFHKFEMKDIKSIEQLSDAHGFYGNLVKNYAIVECPECHEETILLLKQVGQTWDIMNTAVTNEMIAPKVITSTGKTEKELNGVHQENITEQTKPKDEKKNNKSQEFICPECKKVCKSKIGLNAHMRTHNK